MKNRGLFGSNGWEWGRFEPVGMRAFGQKGTGHRVGPRGAVHNQCTHLFLACLFLHCVARGAGVVRDHHDENRNRFNHFPVDLRRASQCPFDIDL